MPFIGLAEAYALAAFRHAGVPMQRIRPAIDVLARELGVEYALASRRLYTDGAEVHLLGTDGPDLPPLSITAGSPLGRR
jgi:hypothetical protein